jgi:putative transposase
MEDFADAYRGWVEDALKGNGHLRDGKWTESVAVGTESFVTMTKEKLGIKAKGREVIGGEGSHELSESAAPYKGVLGHENTALRLENTFFWEENL